MKLLWTLLLLTLSLSFNISAATNIELGCDFIQGKNAYRPVHLQNGDFFVVARRVKKPTYGIYFCQIEKNKKVRVSKKKEFVSFSNVESIDLRGEVLEFTTIALSKKTCWSWDVVEDEEKEVRLRIRKTWNVYPPYKRNSADLIEKSKPWCPQYI